MSTKTTHNQTGTTYFCTFTNYKWLHLFEIADFYNRIYKWFDFLTMKECKIFGYVIMPNHIHLLLYIPQESVSINKVIGEGKRFMAYQIVRILQKQKSIELLQLMVEGVTASERRNNVKHKVFEDSFDCKECFTTEFIQQKLRYMHNNPIAEKWKLSLNPEDFRHSSAKYYATGIQGAYSISHYKEYYDLPLAK